MKKINFEDGELVKEAYVTINDEEIPVTEAEYIGDTPLSAHVMNKLQDNIEGELNSSKTLQSEQIIIENACNCNANIRIYGKTIQGEGTPTPTSPIPIQNIKALNFTKQNEDGTVSETINFLLEEGQILHEGDYIDEDGIHQTKGTITLTGTETCAQERNNRYYKQI